MGDFCERRYFSSVLILFVWTYSSPSQQHWVAPSWSTQRLVWSLQTSRTSQLWTSYFWPELNTQRHQLDNPLQTKGVVMLYILRRIKFLVFPKYLNLRISDTLLKGKFPLKTSKQSFPKILTTPIPSLLYFSVRIYKETCCTDYWLLTLWWWLSNSLYYPPLYTEEFPCQNLHKYQTEFLHWRPYSRSTACPQLINQRKKVNIDII